MSPRHVTIKDILLATILFVPVHLVIAVFLNGFLQLLYRPLRSIVDRAEEGEMRFTDQSSLDACPSIRTSSLSALAIRTSGPFTRMVVYFQARTTRIDLHPAAEIRSHRVTLGPISSMC